MIKKNKNSFKRHQFSHMTKSISLPFLLLSILLGGCARDEGPAPVVSVNDPQAVKRINPQNDNSGSVGVVPLYPESASVSPNTPPPVIYQPSMSQTPSTVAYPSTAGGNTRDYTNIPKGSFSGSVYTVQSGDTLFYVSWITGANVNELARMNNLSEPYHLSLGQQLKISDRVNTPTYTQPQYSPATNKVIVTTETVAIEPATNTAPPKTTSSAPTASGNMSSGELSKVSSKGWRWPTQGQVIQGFSTADGGIKGIEISGQQGQPIYASKAGKVVYAGNALAGYGNLIIINHEAEDLSAYAHNDTLMITEGSEVKAGQQIATMGSTGTDRVKLYFEIRQKGVSTDPIKFLPSK